MVRTMSIHYASTLFATLALGFGTWQAQEAAQAQGQSADLATRVQALEKKLDAQAKELAEARTLAEKTARYAAEQSRAAAAMATVLDESEKAGFTYGINPESRIGLLRGWREALAAAQRDVPSVSEPAAPRATAKR
jgi:uncharacterized protein YlxW (UPF0749 family)